MIVKKDFLAALNLKKSTLNPKDKIEIVDILENSKEFEILIDVLKNMRQNNTFKSLMLASIIYGIEVGLNLHSSKK
jgi:hypothetical protein